MNCNIKKAKKLMKQSEIDYKTSFGAKNSRFDPWPEKIESNITLCRMSVGYEDDLEILKKNSKFITEN